MRKVFSPGRLLLAGAILALITFGVLWLAPSGDYLLLPDEAHPVAPLVTVETPKRGGGKDGIYFVDLLQRRATLLAQPQEGAHRTYRFDIRLQGEGETVFLEFP